MASITKEQIGILVKLESIEINSRKLRAALEGVDQKYVALDARQQAAEDSVVRKRDLIKSLQKVYRESEQELQSNQSKIEASQVKLAGVKTNKEYTSMLKEIEELKAISAKLEDTILESLENLDQAEGTIKMEEAALQETSLEIEGQRQRIGEMAEADRSRLAELDSDLETVTARIDPVIRKTFESVKRLQGGGVSITAVKNEVCQGCNLNVPPQMYNDLQRSTELQFCPHCQRIVYWEKGEAVAN